MDGVEVLFTQNREQAVHFFPMKTRFQLCLGAALALGLSSCALVPSSWVSPSLSAAPALERQTTQGTILGKVDEQHNVLEWLGVDYAQAPVGELRWKAPQPLQAWTGVKNTTAYKTKGVQFTGGQVVGSEDVLNLNIVRPNTNETNLPILVYLHGGNNQTGDATEIKGNQFVNSLDVVYVSVNYRLGALGFNPLTAVRGDTSYEQSGNYALLDIAAALDWIKANAAAFGGDANNIVLSGFSAGGRDVMATLISPLFKDKYAKAISFSGGMTLADPQTSAATFNQALAPLAVADHKANDTQGALQWLQDKPAQVREWLYAMDANRLAPLMSNAGIRMGVFPHLYTDGAVIPREGFDTANYNDVPLMLITGTNEFSLFAAYDPYFEQDFVSKKVFDDQGKYAQLMYARNHGGPLYKLANGVHSARKLAQQNYKSPIYIGEISYGDDPAVAPNLGKYFGAFHGVFEPLLQLDSNYKAIIGDDFKTLGSLALSHHFKEYLKHFIHTGTPNGGVSPTWQPWTVETASVLSLNADQNHPILKNIANRSTDADIIKEIEQDQTLDASTRQYLNTHVLNGRWFSGELDRYRFDYKK